MRSITSLIKEFWVHLPIWFFVFTAGRMIHMNMTSLPGGPRPAWAWTVIPALLVVFLYYARRISTDSSMERKQDALGYVVLAGMAAVLLPYYLSPEGFLPLRADGSPNEGLVYMHEYTTFVWVSLLMLHCLWFRGWRGFVMFFVIGLAYGTALESSGTVNGFFHEQGYHYEIARNYLAPAATILGWTTVFYPTVVIAEMVWRNVKIHPVIFGITAASAGTLLDVGVDPIATEVHLWFWNDLLGQGPLLWGVPALNFASWFFALIPFAAALYWIERKREWSTLRKFVALVIAVPLSQAISGLCIVITMGLVEGWDGPTLTIFKQGINKSLGM